MSPIFFLIIIFLIGYLGYYLLQKDNHWSKVVGGTLTVLLILLIINLLFFGAIMNMISSARYY